MTYGPYTLSGEGLVVFGTTGGILVTDVEVKVTSWPPRTRVVGAQHPYGLWHVGWTGVGWSPGGYFGIPEELAQGFFIESEFQDFFLYQKRIDLYVDTLFYKLLEGVEVIVNIGNL